MLYNLLNLVKKLLTAITIEYQIGKKYIIINIIFTTV